VGLHFEECNDIFFSVAFESCDLHLASFYQRNLRQVTFSRCNLAEADMTGTDLTGLTLEECNLAGTIFEDTVLEKADLRTSFNYSIDPERNRIRKARFAAGGIGGLLDKYDITIE
jgi:uncharacterized protein YjbI with pentapeptide repeats